MGLRQECKESIWLDIHLRAIIGNLQYALKEMLKYLRARVQGGRHKNKQNGGHYFPVK